MFNPKNDVLPKKRFLIIFFSVLSILFFIVVAEQNKNSSLSEPRSTNRNSRK